MKKQDDPLDVLASIVPRQDCILCATERRTPQTEERFRSATRPTMIALHYSSDALESVEVLNPDSLENGFFVSESPALNEITPCA